jgi:hypothetical protein
MGAKGFYPGDKAARAWISPLTSIQFKVEVKNSGVIPPLPHTFSWCSTKIIKHRGNFAFYHYCSQLLIRTPYSVTNIHDNNNNSIQFIYMLT